MVFDFQLPKDKPLVWFATDEDDARDAEATWFSVPEDMSLEEACEIEDLDPVEWLLAHGTWLMGFTEYRRKDEGEQEGETDESG